jgi:hypothetical protein
MMRRVSRTAIIGRALAFPTVVIVAMVRLTRELWRSRYALRSSMICRNCHGEIQLVRGWRCSCGFTYVGSVLRQCPACFARPVMVRCEHCALTWRIR